MSNLKWKMVFVHLLLPPAPAACTCRLHLLPASAA
jgi:hypothetical protein